MANTKLLLTIVLLISYVISSAQYFGRNKPRYESFDFKVVETPHFKIHHYLTNNEMIKEIENISEQWYINHRNIFGKDINFKNPIIIYNSHSDFQQTNTIFGDIGVGTGGVTEALKNRVIMPLAFSNQGTHHVLVHELVHAFQYNNIQNNDSTSLQSLSNVPLWMIEGTAEYLSLGRIDPFTAMWMRDAILNDNLPEISKMNNFKYFPYRYGHALMAFIGGFYGDHTLNPMFMSTAQYGLELGFIDVFGMETTTVTNLWHNAMRTHFKPILDGRKERPQGKKLISQDKGSGRMNLSPSISPNGRYVVYLSEKDVFTTDLFLADAASGEILRKLTSLSQNGDLDYINGLESAGAWAPNSKEFMYVGVKKGKNVLVIVDPDNGKTIDILEVANLDAFVSPTYHPNGKEVVVTGLKDGQLDLYTINLRSKKATALTNDKYAEILPSYSLDGSTIIFSYDKQSMDLGRVNGRYTHDIAILDAAGGNIEILPLFNGADNLNPVYNHNGQIYFVSDRDGLRNLYMYDPTTRKTMLMTDLMTGISGISSISPMITSSQKKDRVLYTHYYDNSYTIYEASLDELLNTPIADTKTINMQMGTLPLIGTSDKDLVGQHFRNADQDKYNLAFTSRSVGYSPHFRLDYIGGGGGIGLGVNNNNFRNATGLQGGVDLLFSDILGNNQLYSQLSMNGELLDVGGIMSYINRKHRWAWGLGFTHVPLRTGYQDFSSTTLTDQAGNIFPAIKASTNLIRIFDQGINAFVHYPFSTTMRFEAGISGTRRSFRWDEYNDYYIGNNLSGFQLVSSDRNRIPTGERIALDQYYSIVKGFGANANIALVGDNSYFGVTAPLAGYRYRLSYEHYIGNDDYSAVLVDARKYIWKKPFSFAFRGLTYFRFINETNSVYPMYVGNMGFVRGYGSILSTDLTDLNLDFFQLLGSKMALASFEIRIPFTGPSQLALFGTNTLLTDVNLFFDSGVAFDEFSEFEEGKNLLIVNRDNNGNIILDSFGNPTYTDVNLKPTIVSSIGLSVRLNLFGALILEPYYAKPLRDGAAWTFGLNLIPGW